MAKNKFLDLSGVSYFLNKCKALFAPISHSHNLDEITDYIVDTELSSTSTNPVENKAVQSAIQILEDKKANKSELPSKTSDLTNDSGFITVSAVNTHNTATDAHNDIRLLVSDVSTKLNNFLNIDDTTKDQLSEIIALIEENADDIESITSGKINVADIIDNLTTNVSNKPLSAAQGVVIKGLIDALEGAIDTHEHNYAGSSTPGGDATSAITLTGLTSTVSELNFVKGVSSNIQGQFDSEITARESGDAQTLSDAMSYTDSLRNGQVLENTEEIKNVKEKMISLKCTSINDDFIQSLFIN